MRTERAVDVPLLRKPRAAWSTTMFSPLRTVVDQT